MKLMPYGTQWIAETDIAEVVDVLRSDWITQGPIVDEFEEQFASWCGAKYAVVVSSGTAALHVACLAAGIAEGDKVATSPITFVASANCVVYAGGEPRFVDIDPDTRNLSTEKLAQLLAKERLKAVIPVHFAGLPCEMERIQMFAKANDLSVIEDAAHALGAEYQCDDGSWARVGSCTHSDMTTFSFHPVKLITTGEGGAITTNSKELYERLKMLRSHGITKDPKKLMRNDGPWYYEMQELGFNYRITDFQCALGKSQLSKLDHWVERRREIADRYDQAFAEIEGVSVGSRPKAAKSAFHLYVVELANRDVIFHKLRERGLGVQVHYIPVHLQPYYQENFGYKTGDFPISEAYYQRCITIPLFPKMVDDQIQTVINAVTEVVGGL